MTIPKQLKKLEFRFCKLKAKDKVPFEKDWQNKGYEWRDLKLTNHIEQGGNYGVIGGYGKLRILDIDDKKLAEEIKKLLPTFTVKTGGGGMHFYFISDYETNHVLINELGELRANNYQVVGAGCIHPNGKRYEIINDSEIITLPKETIAELIKPYLREEQTTNPSISNGKDTSGSGLEYRRVLAMIREGKSRKVIYKEMENYKKWSKDVKDYQDTTYNKAMDYSLKEKELEEEKNIPLQFKKLYKEIIGLLKDWCDLRGDYYSIVALWIIGTHYHQNFSSYPYLFFNAMRGSGKSRVMNLIKYLSSDGMMLNSLTDATLFRTKGTMCIDEFEGVQRKGKEGLRELLNSAYKIGTDVIRFKKSKGVEGEEQVEERFEVYRPICMANIRGMEEVLSDRCITLILEKSGMKIITKLIEDFGKNRRILNIVSRFTHKNDTSDTDTMFLETSTQKWNEYINPKIYGENENNSVTSVISVKGVKGVKGVIDDDKIKKIDDTNIEGRDIELFFPLFLIADKCGVFEETLKIAEEIVSERKEISKEESIDVQLIDFISRYTEVDFVSPTRLTNEFRVFAGIEDKNKWINSTWFGRALRRLVLVKESRRKGNGRQVILDIEKAREKIKMFKDVEDEKIEIEKIE